MAFNLLSVVFFHVQCKPDVRGGREIDKNTQRTARPSESDISMVEKNVANARLFCSRVPDLNYETENANEPAAATPQWKRSTPQHAHVARDLAPDRFDIAPRWHAGLGVRPLVVVAKTNGELAEQRSKVVVRA